LSLVLVADDEPAVLEVLTEVVEDLGHDVLRAHDGREALALARAQQPALVVTDHMMPRLSGVELCRAMRKDERLREVPVILLSAALPPEAEEASAWLAKPFELDEFESLVKRTLDGVALPMPLSASGTPGVPGSSRRRAEAPPDRLIHWVADEMKTPLAAARMNLQLLERRLAQQGASPDSQHFRAVTRQLESMEQIVNSLLDAARLGEGRLVLAREHTDLREVVERALVPFREAHPDFQFELQVPDEPVPAHVDPLRLQQVVANLVSNAIRYAAPPRHVRVVAEVQEGRPRIRVQDFGQGIDPRRQAELFSRFRAPEEGQGEGHGVGLYVASELVRLHGGELEVASLPGEGATFTISLPSRASPGLSLLPS
jgi:two-component system sensor histidine kinase/response regulator